MTTEPTETVQAKPVIITRRMLAMLDACDEQRDLFATTFGPNARVAVNEANARRALDAGLDLFWMAHHGLHVAYLDAFCATVCGTFWGRPREAAFETALIREFVRLYTAQARNELI